MAVPPKYIIFSDASVRRGKNDITYAGYGVVVLNTETREYTHFGGELGGHTVAYSEAYAIYRGIRYVRDIASNKNDPTQILVVTDSKLNVKILSVFIPYVWDLSDWNHWKKADGHAVKNQEVYRKIVSLIQGSPGIHVRVTHINSHLGEDDWERVKSKLKQYGIIVDATTAQMFREMNAIADNVAQSITRKMRNEDEKYGPFIRLKYKGEEE